ncbi:hypothetical protein HMPREF9564_00607 [Cutibacterium acnes HL053PA1]|nr:hypothetical protein HMPREF9616_01008 [Cutibacterium acnes HL007PA1]EFT18949.1 hypothetical protein HMPREF9564_00607 [Cutibacterium acnes HL053PA1]EFT21912.1 hypothetical protein HMPREF9566_00015 [Cutibacterium acnes HL045PA1]EFT30090.1 hypothetical protein HMPREF9595_02605 [Cutibacterium acnes HL005PA2]EFT67642.1 hypothetical protein HMPREF9583_02060 [Cutibacterium acnes HL038PA1]EGE95319.1 hypothetical protein HMPREF9570_00229 [Cutibacterium acnes HL043PA1]EGE97764.1 hypothetical protein
MAGPWQVVLCSRRSPDSFPVQLFASRPPADSPYLIISINFQLSQPHIHLGRCIYMR